MKTNTKRLLSVMLCLAMVLAMLPMAVFAADDATILYVKPNALWNQSNARFAAYFFGNGEKWVDCTPVEGADGIYAVEVPAGFTNIIFCRMNPSTTANNWKSGVKWNQTANLKVPTDGTNCYVVADGTWDKGGGQWVEFTPDGGVGETETTTASPIEYSVAGVSALCGSNWDPSDINNMMMDADGDGIYTITYSAVAAGTYTFKVTDGSWANSWPASDYKLTLTEECDVTIKFNSANKTLEVVASAQGDYVITGPLYVVGTHNEWTNPDADYVMNEEGDGIFTLTVAVAAGEGALKVTDGTWANAWGGEGVDGNYEYTASVAGDIVVTFDANTETVTVTGDCLGEVIVPDDTTSYYVVGTHNAWTNPDEDHILVANEDGTYALTFAVEAGKGALKVTDGTWDNSWGGLGAGGNYEFYATEAGEITVTFNPADGSVVVTGDILGEMKPMTITSLHVVGDAGLTGAEWDVTGGQMKSAMGTYSVTFTGVAAGTYSFKFVANADISYALNWATGLEVTPGASEKLWFNPLGNSSITVAEDNSTVTISFDMTTMDLITGEGATAMVTIEAPVVEEEGDLVLGDNALSLNAMDQDGDSWTFVATEAGELTVKFTALFYDWMGEGNYEEAPATNLDMAIARMYRFAVNGVQYYAASAAVPVAVGDVVTIEISSYNGYATNFNLNLSIGEGEIIVPAEPGTKDNPYVIETVPYEITVEGEHDIFYVYTAEQDGILVITKPAGCYISELPNYEKINDVYYVTVAAGDEITINPWGSYAGTYTIAYGEIPVLENEVVYFSNYLFNWETVYAYAFDADDNFVGADWPGAPMTLGEDGLWSIEIPGNAAFIIFSNGDAFQTENLEFVGEMLYDGVNSVVYGTELNTIMHVAGSFNDWNACDDAYAMTNNGDGTFSLTINNLIAGEHQFKITDGTWFHSWGFFDENVTVVTEAYGNLTINFNLNTQEITTSLEPVEITPPTISLQYPTLALEDTIKMNVYFTIDNQTSVVEMGMLTWTAKPETANIHTAEAVISGAAFNANLGFYGAVTNGIPAQNLGDEIFFCIYAKLSDGSYAYSKQVSYSPTTYAYNQLGKASTSAAAKALYVSILNYGAAAQTYLNYKADALINAKLTDDQKALVKDYSADMVHDVAAPDAVKAGEFIRNKEAYPIRQPNIALDAAFAINYYFTPGYEVVGEMTFYYWNAADFDAADVLTTENATGEIVMTEKAGVYGATISGIAAKDVDSALYACGVYTAADGNTYCTGILPYSLGAYCGSQVSKGGATAPLAAAIAVYGYYAAAFFG